MTELIIVGDEAWTPEEWEAEQRRLEQQRAYTQRPDVKARRAEQSRAWQAAHPERRREYNREWMRRYRANQRKLVGSLHDLACTGPTRATGCMCQKIRCYDQPVEKAA